MQVISLSVDFQKADADTTRYGSQKRVQTKHRDEIDGGFSRSEVCVRVINGTVCESGDATAGTEGFGET